MSRDPSDILRDVRRCLRKDGGARRSSLDNLEAEVNEDAKVAWRAHESKARSAAPVLRASAASPLRQLREGQWAPGSREELHIARRRLRLGWDKRNRLRLVPRPKRIGTSTPSRESCRDH
jgi:hypothetical protein